ncbi:MAG: hypothetical protein R3F37_01180 [Candidatus Competibacteraceae bacterium]
MLERTLTNCAMREKELEGYIIALQDKRRQMQDRLARYLAARQQAQPSEPVAAVTALSLDAKVDKASFAFDRALENAGGMPSQRPSLSHRRLSGRKSKN